MKEAHLPFSSLTRRDDGSFVVNGEYHVPFGMKEFEEEYDFLCDWIKKHPERVSYEKEEATVSLKEQIDLKLAILKTNYEQALAGAIALADPSPVNVMLESALWAVEDAEGLIFVKEKLEAQYRALTQKIRECTTAEMLDEVVVAFAV